jgi:murein DD-endopeptidase MepM/ murein hydrolase activator NlpD
VAGARLGARFDPARVHPVTHAPRPHLGVDFVAAAGTPVLAAAEGIVLSASPAGASGNLVRLSHRALGIETGYAHLARFAPGLRAGRRVRARELIGYVGSTGQSRAPHLHVTVRRGAQLVDPLGVFAARQPLPAAFRESFAALAANLGASLDAVPVDGEAIAAPPRPPPAVSAPPRADDPPTEPDPEGYDVEAPS